MASQMTSQVQEASSRDKDLFYPQKSTTRRHKKRNANGGEQLSVPKTSSFELIRWRRSASDSSGGPGSARTYLVCAFDDTKKQPNDMSPSRICEEWRLFRRQNVRNDDAVRQLEEFARPDRREAESVD
jgi:hypothetical protein